MRDSTYDAPSDQPTGPGHDHGSMDPCPATCPAHPAPKPETPRSPR